jgi:predicted metalloprotease
MVSRGRTLVLVTIVAVLGGCSTTSPSATASASGGTPLKESVSPAASSAVGSTLALPSPNASGVAGTTDPACETGDKECFEARVGEAITLAEEIPVGVGIEEPESFSGGQRTASWLVYLVDTVYLVDRFWTNAFAAGRVPYTHVSYVMINTGQADQRSSCTDEQNRPSIAAANSGPFYCPVGGSAFGRIFQTGTIYVGIPWLVAEASEVNPQNYDFAVVTVIAHEMAHHVQNVLLRQSFATQTTATWFELGADCLAGVFAHEAYFGRAGRLTDTDVEEAIQISYNFGSDFPYDYSGDPHGTHQQRVDAFLQGYNNGSTSGCLRAAWPTNF